MPPGERRVDRGYIAEAIEIIARRRTHNGDSLKLRQIGSQHSQPLVEVVIRQDEGVGDYRFSRHNWANARERGSSIGK